MFYGEALPTSSAARWESRIARDKNKSFFTLKFCFFLSFSVPRLGKMRVEK